MKLLGIHSMADLQELRPFWEELLRSASSSSTFVTWEWMKAWWTAYGQEGALSLIAVQDDEGILRGIGPLHRKTVRRHGQSISTLAFVGDGSYDSDYLDLIVADGWEGRVVETLAACWMEELRGGTVVVLNEIPESSRILPELRKLGQRRDILWAESETACCTVKLPPSWADYLGKLKPRFRTSVRSTLRDLEGRPEVQFGFCDNPDQIDRLLPVLYDLHAKRWAQEGKPGVFDIPGKRNFYSELSRLLHEHGRLRFSWLSWNGQILACQYGFIHGATYFHLQEGYEPAAGHLNLGIGLRGWSIRELMQEGITEYDFLGGVSRHKSDWGADVKISKSIMLAQDTSRNRLFCHGPAWEMRIRESVAALLPEKVLAARRALLKRRSEPSSSRMSLEKAAAKCYVNLGFPRLLKPLRESYQLSVGSTQGLPKIMWRRRTEPSARIFCYHHVNNDADPFAPAISTWLFEQQMKYIARHYKVVHLGKLMDHLQGDGTDSLMAITFDDGYSDNFHNALPILERYGLPATVFLATGGIDSRELLWFEQLAETIKKTSLEHFDLEIDIPRRFWFRSATERLASNNGIFEVLRTLPDPERREWLGRIVKQLGAPSVEKVDERMLTWDQIRMMQARGVEFGGHTVTHPFLSRLTEEEGCREVSDCKKRIEDELQSRVEFFAYPNGRPQDFGQAGKDLIRKAGYRAAVTTIKGANDPTTDCMELRRGGPFWESDPAVFGGKLDWYQWVNG